MTQSFTLPAPPDEALVRQWEEECAKIDAMIVELTAARDNFAQLVRSARGLKRSADPVERLEPESAPKAKVVAKPAPKPPKLRRAKRKSARRGGTSWRNSVELIVKAHPEGISYDRIKELVPEKLKEQLAQFPEGKGFYAALSRLERDKIIVKQNSMAFTKKGFAAYQARVEAGEVEAPLGRRRGSVIEDAIKGFLLANGPSKGSEIRAHLIQFPDFGPSVLKNSSAMYNVLLRLTKNEEILHDKEAATYSIAQENGASAQADAPEVGRAATLPFENVIGFRQPR
jgi:hypothetical protein